MNRWTDRNLRPDVLASEEPLDLGTEPALLLDHLVVKAGSACLLDQVSMQVTPGAIVAVLGANGAGKTTLLDAVSGTMRHKGAVLVGGKRAKFRGGRPVEGVARVFQGSPLPESLTVAEVLDVTARDRDRAGEVMARFGLTPHASTFVGELSTGMRRILDLAIATIGTPAVLLLDEPASGLAASEVERLADLVVEYRDRTGAAVLVVEHDPTFVQRIADEVVVLDAGRVVRRGTCDQILHGRHPEAAARVASPLDDDFADRLARVADVAAPAQPPLRRTLSTWTKLRLGLREFAAGMSSVLILGVLNRVMKVELGISLAVVATILASYNLASPLAMAIGHQSDRRPIFGRHRTPYIIGGSIVTAIAVLLAPYTAQALAGGLSATSIGLSLVLFVVMGVGMYGSGTVYFALIADLTPREERGHAASIVYLELMLGILAGVALSTTILDDAANGLHTLFAVAAFLVVALTTVAVWGLDPREVEEEPGADVGVWGAITGVAKLPTARRFFAFMFFATLFLFLQQAVLEPFGGEVLHLSVRATSGFNAIQTIGVLVGMIWTGKAVADRGGHKRTAIVGLAGASIAFGCLTFAALTQSAPPSWFAILLVGLTTGLFNVATLALMMSMSDPRRMALFMGAWTVSHALADGMATAGGGIVYEAAAWLAGEGAGAYATVFAIEAIGLALCVPLLRRIDPETFSIEVATESARSAAVAMGWMKPEPKLSRRERRARARSKAAAASAPAVAIPELPMPAALSPEARQARRTRVPVGVGADRGATPATASEPTPPILDAREPVAVGTNGASAPPRRRRVRPPAELRQD